MSKKRNKPSHQTLLFSGCEVFIDKKNMDILKEFSSGSIYVHKGENNSKYLAIAKTIKGVRREFQAARIILGLTGKRNQNKRVIFKDNNPLNLTSKNLAVGSISDVTRGRAAKTANSSSKYLGVHFSAHHGKWRAIIHPGKNMRNKHIGFYATDEEAARAYDAKAKELFGDRATLNFPAKK